MKYIYILFSGLFLLGSCAKEKNVMSPQFSVSVHSTNYKVGDTVQFNFSNGDSDFISFYSGEGASDYDYKLIDKTYPAKSALSFRSAKYAGTNPNCASLKYSTDFNGSYDTVSIRQATWTDITSRFHIPPINGNSAVYENSGEVDVSDIFKDAKTPVYFAWFFTTQANSGRTRFRVQTFQLRGIVEQDESLSSVKYDFVNCAFKMVLGGGWATETASIPTVTSTYIFWDGVYSNKSFKEGWAVSAPLYAAEEANLGTAKAVGIKSIDDPYLPSYQYVYDKPGKYKVTFVAANSSIYGRQETVKQLEINIEQ